MEHKNINLAYAVYNAKELLRVSDGDVIIDSNLAQMYRDTVLFEGVKDLTFERCNLINVRIAEGWRVHDCNRHQADYDPAEIYPDVKIAEEQAKKAEIVDRIVSKYVAEFTKQIAPLDSKAVNEKALETSVIAAVSAAGVKP